MQSLSLGFSSFLTSFFAHILLQDKSSKDKKSVGDIGDETIN